MRNGFSQKKKVNLGIFLEQHNLTSSGSIGRKQSNQVRVQRITGDYSNSERFVDLMNKYKQWYEDISELFLDDLLELLHKDEGKPKIEIVERVGFDYTEHS